jgi:ATP-dependent Clp protease ATP-binding subunit ClpB
MIFAGPTGVGKTELVKVLAQDLFKQPESLIRLDMSEFMEKHSVSRIVGAPPGYVGYDEAGQLTEKIRRRPYSVILFDEIEKAHPDVLNILLQVLDDGRITDSQGRTVDFKNTIIILTSNLGSSYLLEGIDDAGNIKDSTKEQLDTLLKQSFRPEFLNRLDEIVFYKPLTKENISAIIDLLLNDLSARLEKKRLYLDITDAAKSHIIDTAYDPMYGARPLKKYLQSSAETLIARKIIAEDIAPDTTITIDLDGDKLIAK